MVGQCVCVVSGVCVCVCVCGQWCVCVFVLCVHCVWGVCVVLFVWCQIVVVSMNTKHKVLDKITKIVCVEGY